MQPVQGRTVHGVGVTVKVQQTPIMPGIVVMQAARRTQQVRSRRTDMVCTICMAMSGSGYRIGLELIVVDQQRIRQGRVLVRVACIGAVAGTSTRGACGQRVATTSRRVPVPSFWVSALRGSLSIAFLFYPVTLFMVLVCCRVLSVAVRVEGKIWLRRRW